MNHDMHNSYEDTRRAAAYAELDLPGTYALAYRDLPAIIAEHVQGRQALDFGCGTGRSTRFLNNLGFAAVGVDIAPEMIDQARDLDPGGEYRMLGDGDLCRLPAGAWDLVLSVFTFDNIPTLPRKIEILSDLARLLSPRGKLISLVSSPEIYVNEWASFSTRDFPENRAAGSGDQVRIIITDIADSRPVVDTVCSDEDYRKAYKQAGLQVAGVYRPLGRADEPQDWVNETTIPPWIIYMLERAL
jgi:SAM-dependent methyltransferase